MEVKRLRAVFMRGGTSKALIFREHDLPPNRDSWSAIFLAAMGSPDPNGRQLDGMGGGISSLSKICVVGAPTRSDADVDFTFAQVSVQDAVVDFNGNCGNMSAAIGPFAIEEGFLPAMPDGEAVVRIHNTNTGKIIVARFPVAGGALVPAGNLALDGVAGTAAPIRLEFVEPGGAKTGKLLPTGSATDIIAGTAASCVDAANPCVFVAATDVGKTGAELPDALEQDAVFLDRMERIRLAASVRMGLARDIPAAQRIQSIPKIAMVAAPRASATLAGRVIGPGEMDMATRMISVGQPHRAVPITGAICLAVAARIPGSVVHAVGRATSGPIRIAHPSGTILVDACVSENGNGEITVDYGAVYRTARRLFEGAVLYRAP